MEIFRNLNWIVTDDGVESIVAQPGCWIDLDCIMQFTERSTGTYYDWPIYLAEKEWIDIAQFLEAFYVAVRFLAKWEGVTIDEPMLAATRLEAFQLAWLTQKSEAAYQREVVEGRRYRGQRMMLFEARKSPLHMQYKESERAMRALA